MSKLKTKEEIVSWINGRCESLQEEIDCIEEKINGLDQGELIQAEEDTTSMWEDYDRYNAKHEVLLELKYQIDSEKLSEAV